MFKRGQLTLFIIIAIVVVAASLGGYFLYKNYQKAKEEKIAQLVNPVKVHVQGCLELTAKDAIRFVGLQGGYYVVKGPFIIYEFSAVPLYFVNKKKVMPTKTTVEKEISTYIKDEIDNCINFTQFINLEVHAEPIAAVNSEFSHSELLVKMEWPITLTKDDIKVLIKDFATRIETRLYDLYEACDKFIDKEVSAPGSTNMGYLFDLVSEKNLYVELIPWENNITVFVIIDNSTETIETLGKTLKWRFANQY